MIQFFQTMMGKKFYEGDFPELLRQLKRLNDNLEKQPVKIEETPLLQRTEDGRIVEESEEKAAADFIASILPEATVQPKAKVEGDKITRYTKAGAGIKNRR
ncbi:MAG: hypothetical protein KBG19_04400 [Bacteroidales bacterium]|nr:hypothetical protein [Bacteroidales bacterium]